MIGQTSSKNVSAAASFRRVHGEDDLRYRHHNFTVVSWHHSLNTAHVCMLPGAQLLS